MSTRINLLARFLPGRKAARDVLELRRCLDQRAEKLRAAHARIDELHVMLGAKIREHQATRRLLSEAQAANHNAQANVARLDGELHMLERSNDNLTSIAHSLRDELKAAKAKRRSR